MADTLIAGTTLVEKESRSIGDVPIGGLVVWDETQAGVPNLPEGFVKAEGQTIVDALSPLNGQTISNFNVDTLTGSGTNFSPKIPTNAHSYEITTGNFVSGVNGNDIISISVSLPDGVVITSVVVDGTPEGTDGWNLYRTDRDAGTGELMASALIGTADTSISFATIDNATYVYFFNVLDRDNGEKIFGSKIIYTTPLNKQVIMRVR